MNGNGCLLDWRNDYIDLGFEIFLNFFFGYWQIKRNWFPTLKWKKKETDYFIFYWDTDQL